jgi:hypothetical protein
MKVKEEHKGKIISINDGILGMIKIDLNTIKPMQERRLIALGYTHLFEDEKVESNKAESEIDESHEQTSESFEVVIQTVKKPRKKKVQ